MREREGSNRCRAPRTRFRIAVLARRYIPSDDDATSRVVTCKYVRTYIHMYTYSGVRTARRGAYDRAYGGLHARTHAYTYTHTHVRMHSTVMCRVHVVPSRRPSDVLLGSRNSVPHSYRITYMLCALAKRVCARWRNCYVCMTARTYTHAHTRAHTTAESRRG